MPEAPNFALPGLMEIDRPLLNARRQLIHLAPKPVQNSHWLGLPSVGPITPGGVQPVHPLAKVEMRFGYTLPVEDPPRLLLSSETGEIVITNPVTWEFNIPPDVLELPAGYFYWEIATTDTEGVVTIYYVGDQLITE